MLQYPRWFFTSSENRDTIEDATGRLKDAGLIGSVEFRSASWFNEKNLDRTMAFLADRDIPLVVVDGPQGFKSSVPALTATPSSKLSIVRFHGRRTATWEASEVQTVERFRYLYDDRELGEWVPRVAAIAGQAEEVHVLFNNCYANYGSTNALQFANLLDDLREG